MIPNSVLMVRPRNFGYNPETAASNNFQHKGTFQNAALLAQQEFDEMVERLRAHQIEVHVFDDPKDEVCPDAVFPNNWLAFIPGSATVLFPVMAESRRKEVNYALASEVSKTYGYSRIIDLTDRAAKGEFLEGTGSIVFDHEHRLAYACESSRTDLKLLSEFCREIDYTPVSFIATDVTGQQIYHTNVLMSVGVHRVILCSEAIEDAMERSMLKSTIERSGKELLDISFSQMTAFAGNIFEVKAGAKSCWVLSETAFTALRDDQRKALESDGSICAVKIPTIEQLGGGSARCMLAGLY